MLDRVQDTLDDALYLEDGEWMRFKFETREDAKVFLNQLSAKRAAGYKASRKMFTQEEAGYNSNLWPGVTWHLDYKDQTVVMVGKPARPRARPTKVVVGPDGKLVEVERFPSEIARELAEEEKEE
jgi:hypothetical protein